MRRLLLTSALLTSFAGAAAALDLEAMTQAERDAFRAEIRDYLLENPEVLMEAIGVLEAREAAAQANADRDLARINAEALFNDPRSWAGGNPEGDITLVEFIDYRCGFCRRAHPEVAELVNSDGNIRIITKEFPILGEQSTLASRFAVATRLVAGDENYKATSDALMNMRSNVTDESLARLGDSLGLDTDAIFAEMNSDAVNQILVDNRALAERLRITGTPTFVMEDLMLRGYVELDEMRALVEELRSEG